MKFHKDPDIDPLSSGGADVKARSKIVGADRRNKVYTPCRGIIASIEAGFLR